MAVSPAPPPTRGWTCSRRRPYCCVTGSPAHAGMDRARAGSGGPRPGLPRPRGDGPSVCGPSLGATTAPPPTRGWTLPAPVPVRRRPGSPAHAGMDAGTPEAQSHHTQAPPPTRGWTAVVPGHPGDRQGSPAHAGMDRPLAQVAAHRLGLPRPRGDGPLVDAMLADAAAAPPPTRGWTVEPARQPPLQAGSPAHAGMDPSLVPDAEFERRLPRPRGDGPFARRLRPWQAVLGAGLPRPRGDGPRPLPGWPVGAEAPPPTRGWTHE